MAQKLPSDAVQPPIGSIDLNVEAQLVLRRRLEWLVGQRYWMAPLYIVLETIIAVLVSHRVPVASVALGSVLLAANVVYAWMLPRTDLAGLRRLEFIQPTVDALVSAAAIWLDVEPLDATAYGLFPAMLMCTLILQGARRITMFGLAVITMLMLADFARVAPLRRWEWAVASAGAAAIGFTVGLLNLRRARSVEDARRADARALEAQRIAARSERLAALGELSAVVAHEVRNPLAVIFNCVSAMRHRVEGDAESTQLLGIVQEEATRLNRILGDMLDLARAPSPRPAPFRLETLLDDALQRTIGDGSENGLRVERNDDPSLPELRTDRRLLLQAIVNIVENAKHAMGRGGLLTVRTRVDPLRSRCVRIEVRDTGSGMSSETIARAFEPFFTTRAEGTGLGLAIVKRIVDSLGGSVAIESRMGEGTAVTIEIPIAEEVNDEGADERRSLTERIE